MATLLKKEKEEKEKYKTSKAEKEGHLKKSGKKSDEKTDSKKVLKEEKSKELKKETEKPEHKKHGEKPEIEKPERQKIEKLPEKEHSKEDSEQAIVNIGMVGHVDHGKCIAAGEFLLLNNELSNGTNILSNLDGSLGQKISESERVFDIPNFKAFSLDSNFGTVSVPARFFVQNYSGKMFEIETKRGKRIIASPKHPLLVNDGMELLWKSSESLRIGDFVASVRKLPSQDFVKDFSPNWIENISKKCWVVSSADFEDLSEKTSRFTDFSQLNELNFNRLRILLKKSIGSVEKELKLNGGELARALKKGFSPKQRQIVSEFFKKYHFEKPKGIILDYKTKSQSFCNIYFSDYWNNDLLRFLALIISEGYLTSSRINFSQDKNELRSEFLQHCRILFGIEPKFYPPFDFQINNKALALFLNEKYNLVAGNSRQSGIPEWVFSLPNKKTAVFLNAFFSAEANFNPKSKQISLLQANRKSIEIITYCLKKFGISHSVHEIEKYATNSPKRTKRIYWQLLISGAESILKFKNEIGVSLPKKQENLELICKASKTGKRADEMIPLSFGILSELTENLGWKKKNYSIKSIALKKQHFVWAYQDCRMKNTISVQNFSNFEKACSERLLEIEKILTTQEGLYPKHLMAELSLSQQDIANFLKISQKKVWKMLEKKQSSNLARAITSISFERLRRARDALEKIKQNSPENIEWDKISKIKELNYDGQIVDLQVPGYHNFIAGIGGIVSHNTSLTKQLTGKWTDTHSEELKRGISIRLGYADTTFYKCEHCMGSESYTTKSVCPICGKAAKKLRKVSFVDAPGHETLMATMLSGAALMQGAILVVAANEECPQPRTAEHLMALKISGIEHVVVAQNKVDLVDKIKALENFAQIQKFLKDYGYENSPIIPTSANFGVNIDMLIEALENTIPNPKLDDSKPVKMYCARSFDINKPGTKISEMVGGVIGGSVMQGKIKLGDEIEISPGIEGIKLKTKVKSLGTANGTLKEAKAGGLIAIGTTLDPSVCQNDRLRGQVVSLPGILPEPSMLLKMELHFLERLIAGIKKQIKVNELLILTVGTMTAVGTVTRETPKEIDVALKNAVVIEKGQKVALSKRENGQWRLIAYGVNK